MTPKIAVCTTFPNDNWNISAAEMLATFHQYWPEDIKIFIQLDEQPEETFNQLNNAIIETVGEDRAMLAGKWDEDHKDFIERWKDHKPESYMYDVVRFSHKVFALEKCGAAIKDSYDYLIWLDSDVITKQPVDYDWLKEVLPREGEVVSYLGREGFYSECGWVAYNLKAGGYDLLHVMKGMYLNDTFKELDGWTDCHVLDCGLDGLKTNNLSEFYRHGQTMIDVWPNTKLAERMVHRKGKRKLVAAQQREKNVVDVSQVNIKTRNCLDHEKICANVKENLSQIRTWASLVKPTNQDIVICSAGPSLAEHIEDIREHQAKGHKIIAVKHAIETLKAHNIKPWAVVLLDPRAHVEQFVNDPDPDCYYFVSSMVDPSVVKKLNQHYCKVIGYHALVNAGEVNLMTSSDLPVSGGSATSTRTIALFSDMFGYKNFHLYGYDLSHREKPDLNEKGQDGNPKYMEITLGTHTHKGKYIHRTFWTEGQFLAQANELRNLYKDRKDINIKVYGDGLAAWQYKHHQAFSRYNDDYKASLELQRENAPTLDEFVNAGTRGSEFSRITR